MLTTWSQGIAGLGLAECPRQAAGCFAEDLQLPNQAAAQRRLAVPVIPRPAGGVRQGLPRGIQDVADAHRVVILHTAPLPTPVPDRGWLG